VQGLTTIADSDFVQRVGATPDEQLAETMGSELRGDILDAIFARMPEHLEPCRASGVDAVVAWNICGRPDGDCDCYEMRIRDGGCHVSACCQERPDVTLTLDPVSFLKLVAGHARGPGLMLRGKLKPSGDVRLARRLEGMFRLPGAADAPQCPDEVAPRSSILPSLVRTS
jgi:SCP-2 sterol transfer family